MFILLFLLCQLSAVPLVYSCRTNEDCMDHACFSNREAVCFARQNDPTKSSTSGKCSCMLPRVVVKLEGECTPSKCTRKCDVTMQHNAALNIAGRCDRNEQCKCILRAKRIESSVPPTNKISFPLRTPAPAPALEATPVRNQTTEPDETPDCPGINCKGRCSEKGFSHFYCDQPDPSNWKCSCSSQCRAKKCTVHCKHFNFAEGVCRNKKCHCVSPTS